MFSLEDSCDVRSVDNSADVTGSFGEFKLCELADDAEVSTHVIAELLTQFVDLGCDDGASNISAEGASMPSHTPYEGRRASDGHAGSGATCWEKYEADVFAASTEDFLKKEHRLFVERFKVRGGSLRQLSCAPDFACPSTQGSSGVDARTVASGSALEGSL